MVAYARATNVYRTVHVSSATPARMLDELLERAIEDLRGARAAIEVGDSATKGQLLVHALRIITELNAALDHERAPDLCRSLAGLYEFLQHRLTRANLERNAGFVADGERILGHLREGFRAAATASASASAR